MKRILALLLVLSLSFSIIGCSKNINSNDEANSTDKEKISENKEGNSIEVDKKLINVEVTIPTSLLKFDSEEELNFDEIKEEAKNQGIKEVVVNDDDTITYIMSKVKHKQVIDEMKSDLTKSINELVNNEDFISIQDIKSNTTFSEFDVIVNKEKFENSFDGIGTLGIVFGSMLYQTFDGIKPDDLQVILNFKDESTGEVFESVTYPDAFNE